MANKDLRRVLNAALNELDVIDIERATSGTKPHEITDAVPSDIPTDKSHDTAADAAAESNDTVKNELSREERVKLALELLGGKK